MISLHRSLRSFATLLACLPLTAASDTAMPDQSPVVRTEARDVASLRQSIPQIGMNLEGGNLGYYGTSYPFIDRARLMGNWGGKDIRYANLPEGAVIVDPATGIPAGQPRDILEYTNLFAIEPSSGPGPHRYIVTWRGAGTVHIGFDEARNVKQGDHTYAFDFAGKGPSAAIVISKLSERDPMRDLHIVRADQVALFQSGQVFSPDFLAKVSQWSVLRFMDWGHTNGSSIVHWSELPEDRTIWGEKGVPLKIMVDLANAAGTDMWYCIPAHADDAFVRQVLIYIRDHLSPAHTLHLEYSNEVWNGGFEQFHYAQAQGEALGQRMKSAKKLGSMEWYGYRSAQIARMTDAVFGPGSRDRVRNVIAPQTYWTGLENYIWDGVKMSGLGTPGSLFEEYAVTTYFGHGVGGGTDADKATVLGWARQGPAGLDAVFRELATGGQLSGNSSLANLRTPLTYHAQVAQRQGLALVAYEGGQHLTAGGYEGKDQEDVTDFIRRIVNDPRMGQLYSQMVGEFGAVGGKTLVAFNDVGGVSKWGAWGVLDNIYQQHSPRYDALVAAEQRAKARR